MANELNCVVDCANALGECPVWSAEEGCLWWIDVAEPTLWRFEPASGHRDRWRLPKPPTAVALRKNGGLVVMFRRGYSILGVPVPGSSIEQQQQLDLGEERFNDGRVDHSGRLWVGTMDRQLSRPIGRLYRFDAGSPQAVDQGFVLSNGIGWSPDSRVMYFAETHSRRIYAFDYDLGSGSARNRGVFVQMTGPGGPDGLTVDAQGNVWVAVFGGGAIEQYRPDGTLARRLALPFRHPTSCTFGDHDLQTLFITTSSMDLAGEPSAGPVPAGGVWAMRVDDVVGQREVAYAG